MLASTLRPAAYARRSCTTLEALGTVRDVAAIAFKIAAIFIVIFALRYLPAVLKNIGGAGEDEFARLANLFIFVAPTLLGIILWVVALPLAKRLFPSQSPSVLLSIEAAELQVVAFSVVGLVLLVSSLDDIVWALAYWTESGPNIPWVNIVAGTSAAGLTVLVGVWLLLGSKGIVGAIHRLRGR